MGVENNIHNLVAAQSVQIFRDPLSVGDIRQRLLCPDQLIENRAEG